MIRPGHGTERRDGVEVALVRRVEEDVDADDAALETGDTITRTGYAEMP